MTDRGRRFVAAGCLAVPPLVVLVGRAIVGRRMPDRLATHWSGVSSAADGFSTSAAFTSGVMIATVAVFVVGVFLALLPVDGRHLPTGYAVLGVCGTAACTAWLSSVTMTLRAARPEGARLGIWFPVVILAILAGLAVGLIPRRPQEKDYQQLPVRPAGPVGRGAGRTWAGHARSVAMLAVSLIGLAVGAAGAVSALAFGAGWWAIVGIISGAVAFLVPLPLVSIVVSVDGSGLTVRSALLGLRLRRIRPDAINQVQAAMIAPGAWGGWGWRWLPGRTAVVLRTGPGIVVRTRRGEFAVTVDDAEIGAGVLDAICRH